MMGAASSLTCLYPLHEEVRDPQGVEKIASAQQLVPVVLSGVAIVTETWWWEGAQGVNRRSEVRAGGTTRQPLYTSRVDGSEFESPLPTLWGVSLFLTHLLL